MRLNQCTERKGLDLLMTSVAAEGRPLGGSWTGAVIVFRSPSKDFASLKEFCRVLVALSD